MAQVGAHPRLSPALDWIDREEFAVQKNADTVLFVQLALIYKWEYIPNYRDRENIPIIRNKPWQPVVAAGVETDSETEVR